MRIITGKLKGRIIPVPQGSAIRPTTDRVKESIFSMLEVHKGIHDALVLDVFAGSGSLGFEAISRGAARVVFVEQQRGACLQLEETAKKFGISEQIQTITAPAERFLKQTPRPFDIIFADPPYEYPFIQAMVNHILEAGWLKPDGWLILEHDRRHAFFDDPRCISTRSYGRTIVSILVSEPPNSQLQEEETDYEA
jgi:16S rRNA (guanine(966)-N(2))-methyltransferase RsmD